jgi:hypothetical protein
MVNDPAPGPWLIDDKGNVYSQPLYVPAPFTDKEGNRHEDHMAGLVALVYGGPKTTALVAAAPSLKAALSRLIAAIDDAEAGEPARIGAGADPGCIECTRGVTPDIHNTGLCPYHVAVALVAPERLDYVPRLPLF